MSTDDFKEAKQAVKALGGGPEVRNIVYEIETVEIRRLYEQLKGRYQGNTKTLRKKLAKQFNRRLRSIDYILYE